MRGGWDGLGPNRLLVLGWHNVESTWRYPASPGSGVAGLERQFRALRRLANVVSLESALDDLRQGRPLPARSVAITFDDGYRDNLTHAVPLLGRLGLPATIFLVPGFLSGTARAWWERVGWALAKATVDAVDLDGAQVPLDTPEQRRAALHRVEQTAKTLDESGRRGFVAQLVDRLEPDGEDRADELFMDWDDARDLVRAGITIGSHTMSHVVLANEDEAAVNHDLRESRRLLREGLDVPVDTIAYPNGQPEDYDPRVVDAARDAGYTHGLAAWGLVNAPGTPPYEIRRKLVAPGTNAVRMVAGMARDAAGGVR